MSDGKPAFIRDDDLRRRMSEEYPVTDPDSLPPGPLPSRPLSDPPPGDGPPYVHTLGGPSIPVPFYSLLHVICGCGKRFWGTEARASRRYRDHYERAHITGRAFTITMDPDSPRAMGLSAGPLPIRQEGEP